MPARQAARRKKGLGKMAEPTHRKQVREGRFKSLIRRLRLKRLKADRKGRVTPSVRDREREAHSFWGWLKWPQHIKPDQPWLLIVALSAILAILLFPSVLERQAHFQIDEVVTRDIKATRSYLVEDTVSTEERRREAAANVLTVYDLDDTLLEGLRLRISQAFQTARLFFEEKDDQGLTPSPEQEVELKNQFEAALGLEVDKKSWQLLKDINFSPEMEEGLIDLLSGVLTREVVPNRELLLDDQGKGIIVRRLSNGEERAVKDLFSILSPATAMQRIRTESGNLEIGPPKLHRTYQRLLTSLASRLVKPNLTPNRHETEQRRQLARDAVKPVFYQVRRGEMMAREGEVITPQILARLEQEAYFNRDELTWTQIGGMFLVLLILLHSLYLPRLISRRGGRRGLKDLIFVTTTILFFFLLARIALPVVIELGRASSYLEPNSLVVALPVAAAAMLICTFLGLEAAFLGALAISFLTAHLTEFRLEFFALFLASSLIGARSLRNGHRRTTPIKAGFWAGLASMVMVLAISLIEAEAYSAGTIVEVFGGLVGGLLSGVIVIGLIPVVDTLFGYTTDTKLLELTNLDQPVLKELLFQAPGTYHHSIVVGNMVEAAAEAIGANPLLAKVAAYYHDVGKTKKPLYFVENQTDGKNRHEKLAPSMSALILIAHTKDGLEIARKAKLGAEIEDIIAQHHGTTLITYFYDKAVKIKGGKDKVNIEDFRYPGPKPQTKEAGLVMLADQVEAATKSLTEPTPARIQGLVQQIINRTFSDDQLSDCELTLKDLHAIAMSFNKVLYGIFHQRIAYPEPPNGAPSGKRKANGDSPPKRTKDQPDKSGANQEEPAENLKRLGIS